MTDTGSETLAVLALDCCDYELARRWDCENLLLQSHSSLSVYAYSDPDMPFTLDIWPTVVTGLHAREHETHAEPEWQHPALRLGSRVTAFLPDDLRTRLGAIFVDEETVHDFTVAHDEPTVFDDGQIKEWPGVTEAPDLKESWKYLRRAKRGELSFDELERRMYQLFGSELGWLARAAELNESVVATHAHVLDVLGHTYGDDEERLREAYERVDDWVGVLRERVDRLVLISDHGIQCTWIDGDEEPGVHSWRAMVSASWDTDVPTDVFDLHDWLAKQKGTETGGTGETARTAVTEEQLRALGYM